MTNFRTSIISAFVALTALIGIGTWIFHVIEDWTWAESFYFSVASLTTVGYGDIHPTTDTSRIIAAFYILIGVGVVIAALTKIGSTYLTAQENRVIKRVDRHITNSLENKKEN